MKKLIILTCSLVLTFSFISCKGNDKSVNNNEEPNVAESSEIINNDSEDNNYNLDVNNNEQEEVVTN